MQLIVLGMHRSGTSLLARLLNLMGAYFGPEGIGTGANRENPKGFWERRDVRSLNDFVLHSAGCDWNRVSAFDVDKLPAEVVATFRAEAAKLLLEMDGHRPWFIKEPRLCILFPLWRPLLEAPVCIQVIRHPLEIAASLQTRNAMPLEVGLGLWEFHVKAATRAAADLPLAWTRYDLLLADTAGEIARLLKVLRSHGVHGLRVPATAEMASFVDQSLQHHEYASQDDLQAHAGAPQVELYRQLAAFPRASAVDPDPTEASRRALAAYEATLPPVPAPRLGLATARGDKALQSAQKRIAKLESDVVERDERIAKLKTDAIIRDKRITNIKTDVTIRDERIAKLKADAAIRDERIAKLKADVTIRDERIAKLKADATIRDERIAKLKADVTIRDERIVKLKADVTIRDERIVKLKADAAAQTERARALTAEAQDLAGRVEATQARLDLALVREAILERQLGDRLADVRRLSEIVVKLGRPT